MGIVVVVIVGESVGAVVVEGAATIGFPLREEHWIFGL